MYITIAFNLVISVKTCGIAVRFKCLSLTLNVGNRPCEQSLRNGNLISHVVQKSADVCSLQCYTPPIEFVSCDSRLVRWAAFELPCLVFCRVTSSRYSSIIIIIINTYFALYSIKIPKAHYNIF